MSNTPETDALDRVNAAMKLIEITRRERDEARRERDEERAITFRQAGCIEELERERDEALYDATQETIKNSTLKSHWITACQERDQWRECAEKLAEQLNWWAGPPLQIGGHHESVVALREFDRLKEASK